jgi:CRISPR system Cascade subunit CasA
MHNFLDEPLIEASVRETPLMLSLPELFQMWGEGMDVSLAGIRRHQKASLHMWLVQLAVGSYCIAQDGLDIAASEDVWRTRLLRIAPYPAWNLVVADETQPALLQSPLPRGTSALFNKHYTNPDALTILVAAKNHVLKQNIISHGSPWTWLCALVELQTLSGYGGRGSYGAIKLNGGLGSRPLVAIYPDMADGARWLRDTTRFASSLIDSDEEIPLGFGNSSSSGIVATWVVEWDGVTQIALADLHPAFIEVSRRLRLRQSHGTISADVGLSSGTRIDVPESLNGRTGDPWAPIDGDDKIMTVSADGWSLKRLRNLIAPDQKSPYAPALLQTLLPTDRGDMFFHGSVVTGGQGKTEGFHEITLPIPGRVVSGILARAEGRQTLGQTAAFMSVDADNVSSILRRALMTFLKGGVPPTDMKVERKEAEVWVDRLRTAVNDAFFGFLWDTLEQEDRSEWRAFLLTTATTVFEEASRSLPTRSELFYRAYSRGMGVLKGSINKTFVKPDEIGNVKEKK